MLEVCESEKEGVELSLESSEAREVSLPCRVGTGAMNVSICS